MLFSSLLIAAALAFTDADADFAYACASNFVAECTPRDAGTVRGRIAANWILDTASAAGADVRLDKFRAAAPDGDRDFVNLLCPIKNNPTGKWIVVISHYDTKPGCNCPGANDGASTSGLLISLAAALGDGRGKDLNGNVLLVWTDGEECVGEYGERDGFQGSKRAVEWIKGQGYDVCAAICLDMLGDRDLNVAIPANSTEALAAIAIHAARRAGVSDETRIRRIPETVKDDHCAFLEAGWSAMDLIDFEYGSKPGANDWWHTREDTIDKVSRKSLLASGKLVVELLNLLLR